MAIEELPQSYSYSSALGIGSPETTSETKSEQTEKVEETSENHDSSNETGNMVDLKT